MVLEKSVLTSRGKISYFELGEGARTLVFLHGWIGSPAVALAVMKEFTNRGFRLIAPYLPGHGNSYAIDQHFTFTDLVETMEEFLQTISPQRLSITGHSMGASLAWEIMARQNILVEKAVLWGAFTNPTHRSLLNLSLSWVLDADKEFKWLFTGGSDEVHHFGDKKGLEVKVKGPSLKNVPGYIKVAQTAVLSSGVPACPVLLMWGQEDKIALYSDWERFVSTPPACTVKFFPGGHYGYIQSSQEFLKSLEDFII